MAVITRQIHDNIVLVFGFWGLFHVDCVHLRPLADIHSVLNIIVFVLLGCPISIIIIIIIIKNNCDNNNNNNNNIVDIHNNSIILIIINNNTNNNTINNN